MELGTRRILHHNVTAHPAAEWTLQQFREARPDDHPYRFLIHIRDSIFSKDLDKQAVAMVCGPADRLFYKNRRHILPKSRETRDSLREI